MPILPPLPPPTDYSYTPQPLTPVKEAPKQESMAGPVIVVVASLVVLALVVVFIVNRSNSGGTPQPTPSVSTSAPNRTVIEYKGEEGKTVLELLQRRAVVEIRDTPSGPLIVAVAGFAPDPSKGEFWRFFVNGVESDVWAGSYVTKNTEDIVWRVVEV